VVVNIRIATPQPARVNSERDPQRRLRQRGADDPQLRRDGDDLGEVVLRDDAQRLPGHEQLLDDAEVDERGSEPDTDDHRDELVAGGEPLADRRERLPHWVDSLVQRPPDG
jgi:hypothetical protein